MPSAFHNFQFPLHAQCLSAHKSVFVGRPVGLGLLVAVAVVASTDGSTQMRPNHSFDVQVVLDGWRVELASLDVEDTVIDVASSHSPHKPGV